MNWSPRYSSKILVLSAAFAAVAGIAPHAQGQRWNDAAAIELATRAVDRRARQIADPLLADYTAEANGKLIFQGQLGGGFHTPPITVKATLVG